ncbi:MAG: hypothetical protein A2W01_10115 [Candidatus Solincola sediminis]|uniref:Uncharacterized protein n=1 Tax=Candidatus Solincola sediminis TaxID=1797199 RepID=A0A1F2WGU0_9ACTN|nr:MAG: hypothetical protein A2Y75_00820 [Candidatus Solincola sediminis]OFW56618.1 MAG: hypothetical protein A2W01_10115 [Candidatus Solincola sediminis]
MENVEPVENAPRMRSKRIYRSFFTKKLERAFEDKELDIPQRLLNVMDVPFDQFSPEEKELYETEIKPLAFVFVEHLMEVYEIMGRPTSGWEEMLERVEPSPIKVLATLVIHEDRNLQAIPDDEYSGIEEELVPGSQEKFSVRAYSNDKDQQRERWWEKKIF